MSKCYFCKKEYEGYTIIMDSSIACFAIDNEIRELYYQSTNEIEQGVCEACRTKHIYDNPMRMLKIYLSVKVRLLCIKCDLEHKQENKKTVAKYESEIQWIESKEKELEKLPEVQKEYRKNSPASYKKPIKNKCCYCDENEGQIWINNPNEKWTKKNCWWICKICDKLMTRQKHLSQLEILKDMIEDGQNLKNPNRGWEQVNKINKDIEKVKKEIDDISYEDGQKTFSIKITKKK